MHASFYYTKKYRNVKVIHYKCDICDLKDIGPIEKEQPRPEEGEEEQEDKEIPAHFYHKLGPRDVGVTECSHYTKMIFEICTK